MPLISSNVYYHIVFVSLHVIVYVYTILDYSSALEYSIVKRCTNIV